MNLSRCTTHSPFRLAGHLPACITALLLGLVLPCMAVEDLILDVPYPLTPPAELFPNIDQLQYIRSASRLNVPSVIFSGEIDIERKHRAYLDAAYSYRSFKHTFGVGRSTLSELSRTSQYGMYSTFHLSSDSLSLQYHETEWYGLEKSIYGVNGGFSKEGRGYIAGVSGSFHRADSLNDFSVDSRYHRFYGYASMLSLETSYRQTPYLVDRERSILLTFLDRFAFRDFLFFAPGIRAEFLSQTYFTPILHSTYLISKHLSFSLSAEGRGLHDDVTKPYQVPFLEPGDSLRAPLNIFSFSLVTNVVIDTLFSVGIRTSARKTKHAVCALDTGRSFLRQSNLDTAMVFYDTTLRLFMSRTYLDVAAVFITSFTPLFEDTIPYHPRYSYTFTLHLKPLKQLTIGGSLRGSGRMYSNRHGYIDAHHLLATSLALRPCRYLSISINSINAADWRERFLNEVHYPGRIITSGITVQF